MDDSTNETRRLVNSITRPLAVAEKVAQIVGTWQIGNFFANLAKNNQTKLSNKGATCTQVRKDLNTNQATVKQACQEMAAKGISDDEITKTI